MEDRLDVRGGHTYHETQISDNARVHLGDVHNYDLARDEKIKESILQSLRFEGWGERCRAIPEAGHRTFRWLFNTEGSDASSETSDYPHNTTSELSEPREDVGAELRSWLSGESERKVFWITGKPGSGKSTMMKYIRQHEDFEQLLETWAGIQTLIIAEHFFWLPGSPMQRSMDGMLQALLNDCLAALSVQDDIELHVLKSACGSRWSSRNHHRQWSRRQLREGLNGICAAEGFKILFFVDGLDECTPPDQHFSLITELVNISESPHVKMILSSRPWEAFKQKLHNTPKLRVEELTYHDMTKYAGDELEVAAVGSRRTTEKDDLGLRELVHDLVNRAEGVFLWLELVLPPLKSEMRKGRNFQYLHELLQKFPDDLDRYFQDLIYGRIPHHQNNLRDTASVLKFALLLRPPRLIDHWSPPSYMGVAHAVDYAFMAYHSLCQEQVGPQFSTATPHVYSNDEVHDALLQTTAFLAETSGDLLTIKVNDKYPLASSVDFVHRSVFDFLSESDTASFLEANSPEHFNKADFLERLRAICLSRLLVQEHADCDWVNSIFVAILDTILDARVPPAIDPEHTTLLQQSEKMVCKHLETYCSCLGQSHRVPIMVGPCLQFSLEDYVPALLRSWPHLAAEDDYLSRALGLFDSSSDLRVIERCLTLGCDPNTGWDSRYFYSKSVWCSYAEKWFTDWKKEFEPMKDQDVMCEHRSMEVMLLLERYAVCDPLIAPMLRSFECDGNVCEDPRTCAKLHAFKKLVKRCCEGQWSPRSTEPPGGRWLHQRLLGFRAFRQSLWNFVKKHQIPQDLSTLAISDDGSFNNVKNVASSFLLSWFGWRSVAGRNSCINSAQCGEEFLKNAYVCLDCPCLVKMSGEDVDSSTIRKEHPSNLINVGTVEGFAMACERCAGDSSWTSTHGQHYRIHVRKLGGKAYSPDEVADCGNVLKMVFDWFEKTAPGLGIDPSLDLGHSRELCEVE